MSASYQLPCSCGLKLTVTRSLAGQEIACSCGKSLVVPTLRELAKLEVVDDVKVKSKKEWNPVLGWWAAIVLALAVFSLAYSGLNWTIYARTRQGQTVEEENRQGDKLLAESTPGELMQYYDEFHKIGLGPRQPPAFAIRQFQADFHRGIANRWMIISGGLFVAAIGMALFARNSRTA